MRTPRIATALLAAVAATVTLAQEIAPGGRRASRPERPDWEFALTAYPTKVRNGDDTTSAIAAADRGPLHLEARYGYETKDSRSAFVGWTFSGGETVTWELTPLVGGAWGPLRAFVPGFEASLAWGKIDLYVEAEFVRDRLESSDNYNYAWSELGFKALEWLRIGAVGQRTRAYGGEREFQRGPFVQVAKGPVTLGAYWFNPGSAGQVTVLSVGVAF
ncbi:MAG: hypothetical protein KIS74_04845 [Burkholderiales bacterium]|nr:hypothetical protein [Burkholderiales bacterium]